MFKTSAIIDEDLMLIHVHVLGNSFIVFSWLDHKIDDPILTQLHQYIIGLFCYLGIYV